MMTWDWDQRPLAVLTSYFYHSLWTKMQAGPTPIRPRNVMLDSGAYSAYQLGKTIDLEAFVEAAKAPGWDEVVSLDVIGDAEASVRNAERIAKLGLPDAMPVFHICGATQNPTSDWPRSIGLRLMTPNSSDSPVAEPSIAQIVPRLSPAIARAIKASTAPGGSGWGMVRVASATRLSPA